MLENLVFDSEQPVSRASNAYLAMDLAVGATAHAPGAPLADGSDAVPAHFTAAVISLRSGNAKLIMGTRVVARGVPCLDSLRLQHTMARRPPITIP